MKGFFRAVSEYGGSFATSKTEKRNIALSNHAAVIACAGMWFLTAALSAVYGFDVDVLIRLLPTSLVFFLPIVLNRFGFVVISRVLLCLLVPGLVFTVTILDLEAGEPMTSSSFVALRWFLLVGLCFPFLFFDLSQKALVILGLAVPVLSLVFFDAIFHAFGVGYTPGSPDYDALYEFSTVQSLVSAFAIGASLFFLKLVMESAERLNQKLLVRLEEQNKLIRRQAEAEVYKLNKELSINLQRLTEREFFLNQSQRVAKMGSWEYDIRKSFTFLSEEMYNILGLAEDADVNTKEFFNAIFGDGVGEIVHDTIRLLRTGKPFDRTVSIRTPLGYSKWLRICAYPHIQENHITGMRGICHDITFYKEAEEMLRASEYKYRSLFEQASDFIAIFDLEGRIHDVNLSWCKTFGYSKEELVNRKIDDLFDPEELKKRPVTYDKVLDGGQVYSERRMVRRDGSILDVQLNSKIFQHDKILAIGRDVTSLRAAQRQIEVSEATFRGAFEYSAIGIALVSVNSEWIKVNRQLCQIVGYREDQLLGHPVQNIMLQEDADQDRGLQLQLLRGTLKAFQRERRYIHSNGSIVWVNLNVSLVKDNVGSPLYFVAQIEDISAKKRAEEKLRLFEANIRATINNTEVMIWSVDRSFNLLMFNAPFANYIKQYYGEDVEIGSKVFRKADTPERKAFNQQWEAVCAEALSGSRITLEENRFGIDFQYSLSPIVEGDEVIGVSIFADNVTEQKERNRELAEANRKVGELKLMSLRSVMSPHFIFNVLNSIQYFIAKNDRLNAINYLSAFSKLVRSILTHSVNNKISLSAEIEMLENYIQLERMRSENKFSFSMSVDPGIDMESVAIPSLLIQPYVENAILHGLYNKESHGQLSIRVREEQEGLLLFEIEDNGIGRAAAMELRKRNFLPHTSMGINITEKRLKLINQSHHAAFEIEDLEEDGVPSGTRVKIRISYTSDY